MEIKLPWNKPEIETIPEITNLLATTPTRFRPWFWLHFINIYAQRGNKNGLNLNFSYGGCYNLFRNCPFINVSSLYRKQNYGKNIANLFIEMLADEKYIYISIDKYYIPYYDEYLTLHKNHDILIFGYSNGKFNICDFFDTHYSAKECDKTQLIDAFTHFNKTSDNSGFEQIYFYDVNTDYVFDLPKDIICLLLDQYLSGQNSNTLFLPYKNDYLYDNNVWENGVNVYDLLYEYLLQRDSLIDTRSFHIFYVHKIVLLRLFQELNKLFFFDYDNHLTNKMSIIVEKTKTIRDGIIKLGFRDNSKLRNDISNMILLTKKDEFNLLNDVYTRLKSGEVNVDINNPSFARLVKIDKSTMGSIENKYGKKGYEIFGYAESLPNNIKRIFHNLRIKNWNFEDEKLPQLLSYNGNKVASCRYFENNGVIDFYIAGQRCNITLYFMDCYNMQRNVEIKVVDASTGKEFECFAIDYKNSGILVVFSMVGHIRVKLKNLGEYWGAFSAIYYD